MPTWEETQAYLRGRYRLVHDAPTWLGMEWRFESKGEPVPMRIKIELVTAFNEPWVMVLSALCPADNVDARSALRYNALTAMGALVVEGDRCYLRTTLPLEILTFKHLDRTIEFIATEATKLRQREANPGSVVPLFQGFSD